MATFTQMAVEVYCGYNYREDKTKRLPEFCKFGANEARHYCIECPFSSFTIVPHQIAYTDKNGEISSKYSIGFGGEMEPKEIKNREKLINIWKDICKNKIEEAYVEYMKIKNDQSL